MYDGVRSLGRAKSMASAALSPVTSRARSPRRRCGEDDLGPVRRPAWVAVVPASSVSRRTCEPSVALLVSGSWARRHDDQAQRPSRGGLQARDRGRRRMHARRNAVRRRRRRLPVGLVDMHRCLTWRAWRPSRPQTIAESRSTARQSRVAGVGDSPLSIPIARSYAWDAYRVPERGQAAQAAPGRRGARDAVGRDSPRAVTTVTP